MAEPETLFDKVWDSHVVRSIEGGPDILFIDRHFIHEVTSPVAFLNMNKRGMDVIYPDRTFATADHNTPTINQHLPVSDPLSAKQLRALETNSQRNGISHWGLGHKKNGIVHVVGPENGITLPGMTIVCETHIPLLTEPLELSPLASALLRSKWFLPHSASCRPNPRK